MRDIKFRGIDTETGEWRYGYYGYKELTDEHFIIIPEFDTYTGRLPQFFSDYVVNPQTVGQYTGIKDKNGKEIYEGDILKNNEGNIEKVVFDEASFKCVWYHHGSLVNSILDNTFIRFLEPEIIGNVYENPELLQP